MWKKVLFSIFLVVIFLFLMSQRKEEIKFNINNNIDFNNVLSETYSLEDVLSLKERYKDDEININDFINKFNVLYFRKTVQGYYTYLKIDSGAKAFVFFDGDLLLDNILILDDFEVKEDFDDIIIGKSNIEMVIEKHKNYILLPCSVTTSLGYITKDGIIIIYSLNKTGELRVDSVDFYSNDELLELYTNKQLLNIPYIYPIDKQ